MKLHAACEPVAFLLGTWIGTGDGHYPTIEPFSYNEEVTFGHVGKPFLSYGQKTRHSETGEPLHAETGYLRVVEGRRIELVVVQPSGIVELHQGEVSGTALELELQAVHVTASAKSVTDVQRIIRVEVDDVGVERLVYDVSMAAVGQPMTHHLHASLAHQQN